MNEKLEAAIHTILTEIGEDPTREGLVETPKRVAKAYRDLFAGYTQDPKTILKTFSAEGYDDMVIVRDIQYFSACEHHMQPFYGVAHVAYIPTETITGLSKIPRLVECFSKRLQNQERITTQIANALQEHLSPKGVAVQISGVHMCMCARGVKSNAATVTSAFRGAFKDDVQLRHQFFEQIGTR